ncbi:MULTISPECIES: hypothetical protein [unclassified Novosphingobium]|uniref:hypothetical protein n=1 Tax=unclassified Novosphingobium TaxID=2644732 RepID=UPI000869593A|nr:MULTISPECIES: hypothetical protein [unclassified Novosphingobium]MBN9143719.1 hypothetical protein [Novosphingobium sp.]ODU84332.1 MAG: hypothetical protein ABT10_02815 [Novosphingobium sp. SCN 63-17]OJX92872.1 MAG: hypothetical protein BGP00_23415 [Novosphingobium sp. 63-713]
MEKSNWTAQRSGAGLSVAITDRYGRVLRKLTSVDRIAGEPDGTIIAHFRNGDTHILSQPA